MENVSKKRRFNEEVSRKRRAEDQGPPVKCPPLQPQASCFDKVNSRDFFALPEQRLIPSERTSFESLFIEPWHAALGPCVAEGYSGHLRLGNRQPSIRGSRPQADGRDSLARGVPRPPRTRERK